MSVFEYIEETSPTEVRELLTAAHLFLREQLPPFATCAIKWRIPFYRLRRNFCYLNRHRRLRWMSYLPDVWPLSNISMVGTHDTMSFDGGDAIETQSLPLSEQLNAGVRAFDIRLARVPGGLALHHGPTYQTADFDDVLRSVVLFLIRNPSETVLMRVSDASDFDEKAVQAQALLQPSAINVKYANDKYYEASGMKNNMLSFSEMFMLYVNNPTFGGRFYQGSVEQLSLGSVRGKILLLRDFSNQVPLRAGPDGSLYITDAIRPDANAIRKITLDGRVSQFASPEIIVRGRDRAVSPPPE